MATGRCLRCHRITTVRIDSEGVWRPTERHACIGADVDLSTIRGA